MPTRRFDGARVREVRRAADRSQDDVAQDMAMSRGAIAKWETGATVPDAHKLPQLAKVLGESLDELFPRDGAPDLADLRSDAGYAQNETGPIIGAHSHIPVSKAERGVARLDDPHVEPLAAAYGVTREVLLAAQERSFGNDAPMPADGSAQVPQTLAEKITYLVEHTYPDQTPPTDAQIAEAINVRAGSDIITEDGVTALRTGADAPVDPESLAVVEGLGEVFSVSPMFFQPGDEVARQVTEGIRFLAAIHQGDVLGLAARGNENGHSGDMLAAINNLVAEIRRGRIPTAGSQ